MAVRQYDNTHRAEQAQRTRAAVLAAVGERFLADGYAATTIRGIAETAGISPETVYKVFGSKVELLRRWIEDRTAGAEPVPIIEQGWVEELRATADRRQRVVIAARATAAIQDRTAAAMTVLAAAAHADERATALWDVLREQRRSDVRAVVALVIAPLDVGGEPPSEELVDIAFALTEPHLHHVLVGERGWTPERYAAWLAELLSSQFGGEDDRSPTKETSLS